MNSGDFRQEPDAVRAPRDGAEVKIMGFVDGDVIPPSCYDRPFRLEPGKDEHKAYDVLRETMQRSRKVGLASVVIEKRQALAAVIPIGRTLVLNVLRLASGLVPGASRDLAKAKARASATDKAKAALAVAHVSPSVSPKTPQANPKPAVAGGNGEVIDLAVRRSVKRPHAAARLRASRGRSGGATLHELKRKPASRAPERQQRA